MLDEIKIQDCNPRDVNGLPHGEWFSYWDNGSVKKISNYKNGKIHGLVKGFDENGNISYESEYKNNELNGIVNCYQSGLIISSSNYKNGIKQGREHEYHYKKQSHNLISVRSCFNKLNRVNQVIQDGELIELKF